MKVWAILLVLCSILSGCASAFGAPSYVVTLTGKEVMSNNRCTGALLDSIHVLTAGHCSKLERVITQDGQESRVQPDVFVRSLDVAVLELEFPLYTGEYAIIGTVDKTRGAQLYGACPFLDLDIARLLEYVGPSETPAFERWNVVGPRVRYVCGGDSGAPLIQDGKVVGVLSAVWSMFLSSKGNEAELVELDSIKRAIELSTMETP